MIQQIAPTEGSRPRGDRTSKADLELRVLAVVSMIEEGRSRSEILLHCANEYGVSRSTGDRYIEEAYEHFKESYKPHMQRSAEISKRRLEAIYQKSMKKEDYRTALMALAQLNRIQGLCDERLMAGLRRSDTNQRHNY
jgi:transposase